MRRACTRWIFRKRFLDVCESDTEVSLTSRTVAALKACGSLRDIESGKRIHAGAEFDVYVYTTLMDMYLKCGSLMDAQAVFNRMPCHSLVSWNTMLLGLAENGEGEHALDLFFGLVQICELDPRTLVAALKACTDLSSKEESVGRSVKLQTLRRGMEIHSWAIRAGCAEEIYVASSLVDVYAKCGRMVDSRRVFDKTPVHNVVLWNALLMGYVENREAQLALEIFRCMSCERDVLSFVGALKACNSLAGEGEGTILDGGIVKRQSLENGMNIHSQAVKNGFDTDFMLMNTLIDMYASCGSILDSRRVFDGMRFHNVVSWNALLMGYVVNGEEDLVLDLFSCITCDPDARSFVAVVKACTKSSCYLERGRSFHREAIEGGHGSDVFLASSLVDMYAKCGSVVDARRVFDGMDCRNTVTWNALMLGYIENGQPDVALELFKSMHTVDSLSFIAALKSCIALAEEEAGGEMLVKLASLNECMEIHTRAVVCGYDSSISFKNILVTSYMKCGSVIDARTVFDRMEKQDLVSWNTLLLGYVENGEGGTALSIFSYMELQPDDRTFVAVVKAYNNFPEKELKKSEEVLKKVKEIEARARGRTVDIDMFLASSLVDIYSKCGSMVDANRVFERMDRKDVALWNALMLGYVENAEAECALHALESMKFQGYVPDVRTFALILKALGSVVDLTGGRSIHSIVCKAGLEQDALMELSLVDFYAKCGTMVYAQQVFDMSLANLVTIWNALLAGYSSQGEFMRVVEVFHRMQDEGLHSDAVTWLCILTACNHAGLVEEGKRCFYVMSLKYNFAPCIEHYHCLIDLLGRANKIDEVMGVLEAMPYKADEVTWTTVLSACSKWKNAGLGKVAFESLVQLDGKDSAAYTLMSNIYK